MNKKLKTCVQAIHYLLTLLGETDKLKIVKLMYLADKLHLIRYGRTITGDSFVAMKNGPVGSTVLDVLSGETGKLSKSEIEFCETYIEQSGKYDYHAINNAPDFGMLSNTDRKVLKETSVKFGNTDKWQLVELTHKYPEWAQFKRVLDGETIRCQPIEFNELFSTIQNDPLGITQEMVEEAKGIYLG